MLKKLDKKIGVLLGVIAIALSMWLLSAAHSVWQERQQLCSNLRQQQTLLDKRQQFAVEHADYESYRKQQEAKLAQLRAQVKEQLQLNNVMQRLQKQARAQGVELAALHAAQPQRAPGGQLTRQQLKISAAGDYFALLRWLRQAERTVCQVKQLRLTQGAQDKAKLTMEITAELQVTN